MQLMRVAEVARQLRLAESTVYLLVQRGEIPVVRFGRSVRIPAEELQRWLANRLEEGA